MPVPRSPFAAAAVAAAVALVPTAAQAHSVVVTTTPAEGATVDAPRTLTVRFNEDIRTQFAYARLAGPAGTVPVTTEVRGPDLVVTPGAAVPGGAYTLSYRVASEDTHPVSGTVHFTVRGATSPTAVPTTPTTTAATPTAVPTASATGSPAASPSTAATPAASDSPWVTSWPWITLAAGLVAIAGWFAGRAARRRR